jgi:hypothetical protein
VSTNSWFPSHGSRRRIACTLELTLFDRCFCIIEDQLSIEKQYHINPVHAFGEGLRQAQIGVETAFVVDARGALDANDDVKVVVASEIISTTSD